MSLDDAKKHFLTEIRNALVSSKALDKVESFQMPEIKVDGIKYCVLSATPPVRCDYCGKDVTASVMHTRLKLLKVQSRDNPQEKYVFCSSCLGNTPAKSKDSGANYNPFRR